MEGGGLGKVLAKQHNHVDAKGTPLGGSKRQRVDAALPGHFGWRTPEGDKSIREARAIYVQPKSGLAVDRADRFDLIRE
jgi:hypothetical protein